MTEWYDVTFTPLHFAYFTLVNEKSATTDSNLSDDS